MSKQEFFVYDGERLSDDGMTETTVIAANRMATLAMLSPEVMGAQNEITVHEPNGKRYPAPRGGFFGTRGYDASHLDTPEDDFMVEVTPRMSADDIAAFGNFLGGRMVDTGLLVPGECGIYLHDLTGEDDTVTRVAGSRQRPTIDDIVADMELAPQRLDEQTMRIQSMAPALTAATRELPAA